MPGSDELYPPTQYGWGWLLLAVGVLALLVAGGWLLIVLTRPKRRLELHDASAGVLPADVLQVLRTDYLGRIAQVEAAYSAGGMDARRVGLELSRTVRAFVNEYSGLAAPVLALDDLVALGVQPELIDALSRHYYPAVFRRTPAVDPVAGIAAARTVVTSWS